MRIVAGEFKGRVIESPSEATTRPTTDRVRESIFSSVYSRIPELEAVRVLDAFAGSGGLGIEAISRGAESCVFYERDVSARRVLENNLSALGLKPPRVQVRQVDVLEAQSWSGPFGLVLLDPPYAYESQKIHAFLAELARCGGLTDGCVIVYEHALDNKQTVSGEFEGDSSFVLSAQKKYGKIGVSYFRYSECED